jgi:acetoin utilization deacetylase AcuC-like enzyme
MTTAFYNPPACRAHDMGSGHPESPLRLDAIANELRGLDLDAVLVQREAPEATVQQLERAHDRAYVRNMLRIMSEARDQKRSIVIDPDTICAPATGDAALRAAGAAVAATDDVIGGRAVNAFCAVRPPGHHATRNRAMGFSFFNNVAIAARHALEQHGLRRVAIIDFDVHHGNGTEDILADDERALMVSFFQHPLYPGSGVKPLGRNMVNVPIPPHSGGAEVRTAVETQWLPRLREFEPEMLFVSAGFDAHRDDPLAQMNLVVQDYTWLTERIKEVADTYAHGRIVSCLEGGYALNALARSVAAHVKVLAGV